MNGEITSNVLNMNTLESFKQVKSIILDVDGVLTNSQLLITEKGELLRSMNAKDGYAMRAAIKAGLHICIITGGKSQGVVSRLKGLGIQDIYIGASDKLPIFKEYLSHRNLTPKDCLYMGDDMPDLVVLNQVGLRACTADAIPEIRSFVDYVSPYNGGMGCVRDVIEKVLKLKKQWPNPLED